MVVGGGESVVYRITADGVKVPLRTQDFHKSVRNSQNRFLENESLETHGTNSTATVWFESTGGLLHLGEESEVTLVHHPDLDQYLLLKSGSLVVSSPPGSAGWSAVAASPSGPNYALVRGGSLRVTITDGIPAFELLSGEGWLYERKQISSRRLLIAADGAPLDPGSAMSARQDRFVEQFARRTDEISRFGHGAAGVWISDAEQGDLTPQRGQEGPQVSRFSQETDRRLSFDQASTATFALQSTGRIETRGATGLISVSQALFQTGSTGSFAIAARIENTRIIGPGFSGPLSSVGLLTGNREFLPIRIRK